MNWIAVFWLSYLALSIALLALFGNWLFGT